MSTTNWATEYQQHLYFHIAPIAIPDSTEDADELRKRFVNNDAMPYHIRIVTHDSFDANQSRNLQTPEFIGDPIMGLIFSQLYAEKNPEIDQETLTNLKSAKVWKAEQAKLSQKLGLDKFLRSVVPISESIREDMLEAMFSAVMDIGNKFFAPGVGYVMCRNIMIYLYADVVVSFDPITIKNPKAQLKEIGDKLHWYDGAATIDAFGLPTKQKDKFHKTTSWNLVYYLTPRAQAWMRAQGKDIVNKGILADVTTKKKDDVTNEAVIQALKTLKDVYGVDWHVANKKKMNIEYSDDVKNQMKKNDYKTMEIVKFKDIDYYQLVGTKKDGTKEIALTILNETRATVENVKSSIITRFGILGKRPKTDIIKLT